MSIVDAISRVEQLQALTAQVHGAAPGAVTGGTAFAAHLDAAYGPAAPAATTAPAAGRGDVPFAAEIDAAASRHGIDPAVLRGLIAQESAFDPSARSGAGASGLTQLMPATAAALGVNPTDPVQAIEGGARYLREQLDRFGGDMRLALAAYNAGPGAVSRHGGIPPYRETQNYVTSVLERAEQYRAAIPAVTTAPALTFPAAAGGSPGLTYSTT